MTRTESTCMVPSLSTDGFDCQHCGLHVDECIEEDGNCLQDERFLTEREYQETNTGRILTTTARHTRLYTDLTRNSLNRKSPFLSEQMDSSVFRDAPLSSARQPDLKTFTFRNGVSSSEPTKHVIVYDVVNRSPRYTIKTIPRKIASSTESSSIADSEEISVDGEGEGEDYSADVDAAEVSVDWPQQFEPGEVSVDGPEVSQYEFQDALTSVPQTVGSSTSKTYFQEFNRGRFNRQTSSLLSPIETDTSVLTDSLSPDSSGTRAFSPENHYTLPTMTHMHPSKSMTEINLYKIFYPERVAPGVVAPAGSSGFRTHPQSVKRLKDSSESGKFIPEKYAKSPNPSNFSDKSSDEFPSPPSFEELYAGKGQEVKPSRKRWHSVETPIRTFEEYRKSPEVKKSVQEAYRNPAIIRPPAQLETAGNHASIAELNQKPKPVAATSITDQVSERNVITVTPTAAAAEEDQTSKRPASLLVPAPTTSPKQVQVRRQQSKQKQLFGGYEVDNVEVRTEKVDREKVAPESGRIFATTTDHVHEEEYVTKEVVKRPVSKEPTTSAMHGAATFSYINRPSTGSNLKSSTSGYSTTSAQLQRFLAADRDEGASTVSSLTLPYSVDGTKVIYPTRSQQPVAGYASSRVSTTSELDGYPTSPSPSIPDSSLSINSRGSAGRLPRRTHATIYLKSDEPDAGTQKSRSKVDLTVESETGLPFEELQRLPATIQQQVRRASSSSSSGRGVQKLTIKMTLKESKSSLAGASPTIPPSPSQVTQVRSADSAISVSPPANRNGDDLPNGATAASTTSVVNINNTSSYRSSQQQLLPSKLAEADHRRAVSSSYSAISKFLHPASKRANSESKAKLSASQVELFEPEVIMAEVAQSGSRVPIYERRPVSTRDSSSRLYAPSAENFFPTKAVPYRSYERLDIESEDGGRVMREVVEELKNNVINIKVHERGDHLSQERARRLENGEDSLVEPIEQTVPAIEKALTAGKDGALVLPEKPASPRSRRDKYELHQAMSWKREFDMVDADIDGSATPAGTTEVEYQVTFPPKLPQPVLREETRIAESRTVSAPPRVQIEPRVWNANDFTTRPASPPHAPLISSEYYSTSADHHHISYRSIFDKCFTDERIEELRKSASDLRALADADRSLKPATLPTTGANKPASNYQQSSSLSQRPQQSSFNAQSYPATNFKCDLPPAAPPRTSSAKYGETTQFSEIKSSHHEVYSKTTSSMSTAYQVPESRHVVKDPEFKLITQYKSSPILRHPEPSQYQEEPKASSMWKPTDSFTYKPKESVKSYERKDEYKSYEPKDSFKSYDPKPISAEKPQEKLSGYSSYTREASYVQSAFKAPERTPFRGVDTVDHTFKSYTAPKEIEKSRVEPRSTGSSWAYGYKLPDEQYRSISADRPVSHTELPTASRAPPVKTVEPAIIEALRNKKPSPPSSPDIRAKDWVPPCKAKILQAKRKYMSQQPSVPAQSVQDPFEKYKYGSRDRMPLRMSRESLDAINKEVYRGRQNNRGSAPDLRGSQRTLADPGVYRSKIQWPEREIQAKLSASQEYLARKYDPDYDSRPTTSSFANRWDARSRSLPPMSRYSKSAANTPMESPYPEYMDSNKAKSMEFLADVKKYDYRIVPENQLQRENISGYSRSRQPEPEMDNPYSDQVRKSLQKLDLPDWYINSPYSQPGVMEGTILRHRAHSTTDSNYSPYNTLDRSEMTSPTGTTRSTEASTFNRQHEYRKSTSKPTLSTSRDERTWDMYTGSFYDKKKTRPTPIYSPASETRTHYNPHDSGWSSDWNSHPESSQDSDESNTDTRTSPRAWNSNVPPRRPTSDWYENPLRRRDQSEPARPIDNLARPEVHRAQISSYVDPRFPDRRVLQVTPWEVTSVKTETFKKENLAKKTFVTETNDPVKISQFSPPDNSQWGSYV